jgi:hypothetical protein
MSPGCVKPESVHPRGPVRLPALLPATEPIGHPPLPEVSDTGHFCSDLDLEDIFEINAPLGIPARRRN